MVLFYVTIEKTVKIKLCDNCQGVNRFTEKEGSYSSHLNMHFVDYQK